MKLSQYHPPQADGAPVHKINFLLAFLLLMSLSLSSCNESGRPGFETSSLDEGQWEVLIEYFISREARSRQFSKDQFKDIEIETDFIQIHADKVALVLSKFKDTIGVYQGYLIEFDPLKVKIFYVELDNHPKIILNSKIDWYRGLKKLDSLWSLFGDDEFWLSKRKWKQIYKHVKLKRYSDGGTYEWENGYSVRHLIELNSGPLIASSNEPISDDLLGLILTTQISKHQSFQKESSTFTVRQEFLARSDNRFIAIVSKRSEQNGIFKAVIGKQVKDSIEYRFISTEDSNLSGITMKRHLYRLDKRLLWQYFGDYGFWEDEKKFNEKYENAETEIYSIPIN